MATQVQWRGGSTAEHATFTGAAREVTVDTQKQTLVVHNGSTVGGEALLREDQANLPGSVTNGIYTPGTNQVAVATNGAGRVYITNLGLGVGGTPTNSDTGYAVDAHGPVLARGAIISHQTNAGVFAFTGNETMIRSYGATAGTGFITLSTGGGGGSGDNEKMRITSAGNVGIGTTGPEGNLHVLSTSAGTVTANANGNLGVFEDGLSNGISILTPDGSTGSIFFGSPTSNRFAEVTASYTSGLMSVGTRKTGGELRFVSSNAAEAARIDSSGRLLVGTSSTVPNSSKGGFYALLQVKGFLATPTGHGLVTLTRGQASTSVNVNDLIGSIYFTDADGGAYAEIASMCDGAVSSSNDTPGRLVFSTTADGASTPTERMRITSGGLMQMGDSAVNGGWHVFTADSGTANQRGRMLFRTKSGASGGNEILQAYLGAVEQLKITANGNILNANNSYGALSDLKLKENIVDATSQWDDLKALQVRNYNFKEGQTHTQIGLVAQEVEFVSPGLVSESPDRDEDGNDLGTVTKSVNYSVLYMKAVKALQEAMERIEVLEQRLNDAGIN